MNWYANMIGYLEISLTGDNPERVINMALSRGIYLWDIRQVEQGKFTLKIRLGGYKALRYLVRRSSCRMKINRKRGAPFVVMRVRKRKVFAAGLLFFCIALYILSSFVWFIEVSGNKKIETERILEVARKNGLEVGVPRSAFSSDSLKDKILRDIPELAWAGIHIRGTKVVIEVAEKTPIPSGDEQKPGDVWARANGKIEELLVLTGTARVKEGDYVHKGQILISGLVYPRIQINTDGSITPDGEPQRVRARGLVRARVERTATAGCFIKEERDRDTGSQSTVVLLRYKDWEVILRGPRTIPYERYRMVSEVKTLGWGRIPGEPVELVTIAFIEQVHEVWQWGIEGAYREAVKRAKEEIIKELPADFRIISEKIEPAPGKEPDFIRVVYTLETLEDIGSYSS